MVRVRFVKLDFRLRVSYVSFADFYDIDRGSWIVDHQIVRPVCVRNQMVTALTVTAGLLHEVIAICHSLRPTSLAAG